METVTAITDYDDTRRRHRGCHGYCVTVVVAAVGEREQLRVLQLAVTLCCSLILDNSAGVV